MKPHRLMRLLCAVGVMGLAAAVPGALRAQGSPPDTTRRVAPGQAPAATTNAKGARPASGPDLVTAKAAARAARTRSQAAPRSPAGPPQPPAKVKRPAK